MAVPIASSGVYGPKTSGGKDSTVRILPIDRGILLLPINASLRCRFPDFYEESRVILTYAPFSDHSCADRRVGDLG